MCPLGTLPFPFTQVSLISQLQNKQAYVAIDLKHMEVKYAIIVHVVSGHSEVANWANFKVIF